MYTRVQTRAMKAMRKDELRQASLSRAWRNGFFAMLGAQPVLALGLTWSGAAPVLKLAKVLGVTVEELFAIEARPD
jgi:hypothetical protein